MGEVVELSRVARLVSRQGSSRAKPKEDLLLITAAVLLALTLIFACLGVASLFELIASQLALLLPKSVLEVPQSVNW